MYSLIPFLFGTAANVMSSIVGDDAQINAAKQNAYQARLNAELVMLQTDADERAFRVNTRKQLGIMKATAGTTGLQNTGSIADVLAESARAMELDAIKLKNAGLMKAFGLTMDAALSDSRANSYESNKYLKAAGYLMGGAASVLSTIPTGTQGGFTGNGGGSMQVNN